jgi:hypothetical protein
LGNPYDAEYSWWFTCPRSARKALRKALRSLTPTSGQWNGGAVTLLDRYADNSEEEEQAINIFAEGLEATRLFREVKRLTIVDVDDEVLWGLAEKPL